MIGDERIAEAGEGIDYVRDEIAGWLAAAADRGPAGAHLTRLAVLRDLLGDTLDAVAATLAPPLAGTLDVPGAYTLARLTDRRVLFCRRLFRWYALRFDQRAEEPLGRCLAGADEVVWSVWERTFAAAGAKRRPAPLCFVDNDPIPWASLHGAMPAETSPPSRDSFFEFFTERSRDLPVPVIGLPPVVARRPWWLVTVIHETGHHVQDALAGDVPGALAAAAEKDGAPAAEQRQWSDWSGELFADAFAAVFGGAAAGWAVTELERAAANPFAARPTYPPAEIRVRITRALVAGTSAPDPGATLTGTPPGDPRAAGLLARVPAIADALLDLPVGGTTPRALAGDGRELAEAHARWAAGLRAGIARPAKTLEAAAACVGGAVRAWDDGGQLDPATLRDRVLAVLPECRPDGTRATEPVDRADAGRALIDAVLRLGEAS